MPLPLSKIPDLFISQLNNTLPPDEVSALLDAIHSDPITSIRVNRHKTTQIHTDSTVNWCPQGHYIYDRPAFIFDPEFHAGAYYVQEASSMSLWTALGCIDDIEHPRVLDLCAAPGGKSTLIASYLDGRGLLVSNEVIKSRAYTLKHNITKEAYPNVIVTNNDPDHLGHMESFFDLIVIDAPCSGEGMFRKDKAAMTEWSPENVDLCSARQKRILADILPALKPGGHIIYSTCTYNEQENIDNIIWMSEQFQLHSRVIHFDAQWGIETVEKNHHTGYQFYPHRLQGEGLFIALLQKPNDVQKVKLKSDHKTYIEPTKKQVQAIHDWCHYPEELFTTVDKAHHIHLVSDHCREDLPTLAQYARIITTGISIGTFNKDLLIVDHGLALSAYVHPQIMRADLDLRSALLFLKKELPTIDHDTIGWTLLTYNDLGIGWIKNLGSRINNYLPNELRILKALEL
jgi:16S rRNA C967 or C1407 C5-methylase (RsmB/RsmF family)/NOL1/NOP2/fmu family ribosome biogenesis protein